MGFFKAITGVLKTVAPVAANLVIPGSGSLVGGLIDEVVPGDLGVEEKSEIIMKDPKLLAELKSKALDLDAELARCVTENRKDINETMRKELLSGSWYQRAWRPFNGFMFPLAVLAIYVGVPVFNIYSPNPLFELEIDVPEVLWMGWLGILGVAVYGRNQEKQATKKPGLLAAATKLLKRK